MGKVALAKPPFPRNSNNCSAKRAANTPEPSATLPLLAPPNPMRGVLDAPLIGLTLKVITSVTHASQILRMWSLHRAEPLQRKGTGKTQQELMAGPPTLWAQDSRDGLVATILEHASRVPFDLELRGGQMPFAAGVPAS